MRNRLTPWAWSLRHRLLAGLLALVVLVTVGVGVITSLLVRQFLVDRLDAELAAAAGRAVGIGVEPPDEDDRDPKTGSGEGASVPNGPQFLLGPGQRDGTLGALVSSDGRLLTAAVLHDGEVQPLNASQTAGLAAAFAVPASAGRRPKSVDIPGAGDFRTIAVTEKDGETLVEGLPLAPVHDLVWKLVTAEGLLALAAVALAALAARPVIAVGLRPLTRVAGTARRVSQLSLERGEVAMPERVPGRDADPNTDVGQVGAALNRMLDHVAAALSTRQASETRVRQFVADASHELRTPLAAIVGYTELSQRRSQSESERGHALGRIAAESERMGVLVDDLLLLARLDTGRPLARDSVDLTRICLDVVSDARATSADHSWRLQLPAEPVLVHGDDARLRQVLGNLLANARTHTPAGTTVTCQLQSVDAQVTLQVCDDGPGISAELLPSVFERFARGDSSRSRAEAARAGSSGLGLAIVNAIVNAYGGSVAVTSEPGSTVFTVRLPLAE